MFRQFVVIFSLSVMASAAFAESRGWLCDLNQEGLNVSLEQEVRNGASFQGHDILKMKVVSPEKTGGQVYQFEGQQIRRSFRQLEGFDFVEVYSATRVDGSQAFLTLQATTYEGTDYGSGVLTLMDSRGNALIQNASMACAR